MQTAVRKYYIYQGIMSFITSLTFTMTSYYQVRELGLHPYQILLIGLALELSYFSFEIPTGAVADLYGRKRSMMIGLVMMGIGYSLQALIPTFIAVIASQICWGIGFTFISGAREAWISDEYEGDHLEQVFLTGARISSVTTFAAIFAGILLANITIATPILVAGIGYITLAFYVATFPEKNFTPMRRAEYNFFSNMKTTIQQSFEYARGQQWFLYILVASLFIGLFSEGYDRLWAVHFFDDLQLPHWQHFKDHYWVAILRSIGLLINIFVLKSLQRKLKTREESTIFNYLMWMYVILMIFIICYASSNLGLVISSYWMIAILRYTINPLMNAEINRKITDSSVRATLISSVGQIGSLGEIISGLTLSIVVLKISTPATIILASLYLVPAIYMFFKLKKNAQKPA